MEFLKDEGGQGAAEYILLFGGVIVIAIAALLIYKQYIDSSLPLSSSTDAQNARGSVAANKQYAG
ncbi:class III signal peptide-containing protein [Methanobacterium sp. MBAC-LM]|uniref:class III signal peptide-containing protein n=1 Tax=Methanobacterium sp. MBAC-LM TaxID=3412034 RepID=UPI003C70EC44